MGNCQNCSFFSLACDENLEKRSERWTPRKETCICREMGKIMSQNLSETLSESKIEDETSL